MTFPLPRPFPSSLLLSSLLLACSQKSPPQPLVQPTLQQPTEAEFARHESLLTVTQSYVTEQATPEAFTLFADGQAAPIIVSDADHAGVRRAAADLQADVEKVGGVQPVLSSELTTGPSAVIVGTLGQSPLIDQLVADDKLDASELEGRWEKFVITPVEAPGAGLERALVIAGSDKRGTIYGIYDLTERMGVSPWYDFADVPPKQRAQLHILPGQHTLGEPSVKYRGIFINDENPALLDWYNETYSGDGRFGAEFYTRVFELLLRMKGNFLWPAMWGKSFNDDDPDNPRLADEYGIVMGTSHHEPMTRSQQEWSDYGSGDWRYDTNGATLRDFWREGIERMGDRETLVTVGMRGDGDVQLDGATQSLMETIVADQRDIIADVTGRDPSTVPQVWALYKEVQTFYDNGMTVPDDVTLLLADDNWGNIRRLPSNGSAARDGGFGVYYHFDYVGGPRSYKWLNTNSVPRVWEQMRLAHSLGANQIWLVNVGDLKPMEFPIHFFLDHAWDADGWTAARMAQYPKRWAQAQFGPEHAEAIGRILAGYTKFNARRKPELLSPDTYSLVNYREAETVVNEFNALVAEAERIYDELDERHHDAFYQLVLFPTAASANLNELYYSVAKNRLYAQQQRAATNDWAMRAQALFENDAALTDAYHSLGDGKWNHMMKQTHIGYTDWQEPASNVMPTTQQYSATGAASMGVAVEGSSSAWPGGMGSATLPELIAYYPDATRYLEVFNRGGGTFDFTIESDAAYVTASPASGSVDLETRVELTVDWSQVPVGKNEVTLTVSGSGASVDVSLPLHKPDAPSAEEVVGFVESNGYISINAEDFTAAVGSATAEFEVVPDLGRTSSAVTINPPNAESVTAGGDRPHLQYNLHLFSSGQVTVRAYLSPTLPIHSSGLRYAVSFDDAAPQVVDIHSEIPMDFAEDSQAWQRWVSDNIIVKQSTHTLAEAGPHVLKFWMVDPAVVLQKLVVETQSIPSSYLGPPAFEPLNHPEPPPPTVEDFSDDADPSVDASDGGDATSPDTTDDGTTAPDATAGPNPDDTAAATSDDTTSGPTPVDPGVPPTSPAGTSPTPTTPTPTTGPNPAPTGTNDPTTPAPSGTGVVGEPDAAAGDDGCGCRIPGKNPIPSAAGGWALAALGVLAWRRRRQAST